MKPSHCCRTRPSRPGEQGTALAVAVHVVLLLLVLGQIVYLCSRHRVRLDLTADSLWSTTESTRTLLGRLEKRLVVEAYFSPKEKLPVTLRESRAVADNFLDEIVQLGNGKVVVKRFDPNADKAIADRCQRIGVKQVDLRTATSTSISMDRHWQGLRLEHGGGKQKVIEKFTPTSSFEAEAMLTPAIKEVTTGRKPKFGYMEWPANAIGQQNPGGIGWNALRVFEGISKRYEFQNFKDDDAALLPAELETLFLFRPKDLTDRQKYVLDQFVVRGGTLVVLADAVEYAIGPQRVFQQQKFLVDAAGSTKTFGDQLLHYGIDWKQKLLADKDPAAHAARIPQQAYEYFAVPQMTQFGQAMVPVPYPYFFHARDVDWKMAADHYSRDSRGQADKELAETYRKLFVPGMPTNDFLFKAFKQIGRGPGFYWPTWVGLRQRAGGVLDMPEGVEGRVLLWSSPAVLVEDPPHNVNPIGHGDPQQRLAALQKFKDKLDERLRAEPRQQAPLMVEVKGHFTSFFAGVERPKRPSEIKEEQAAAAAKELEKKDQEAKDQEKQAAPDATAGAQQPEKQGPEKQGPELPKPVEAAKPPPEAAPITKGEKPGRIVVIGDSDFLRDDFVRGEYAQAGGPHSAMGGTFFLQLLDWIAEDADLVALQARVPVDRTLKLVESEAAPSGDARLQEQALRSKTSWLRGLNVVLPTGLLAAFGLGVMLVRRAQKRSFLTSLR
ncbi:MAG TPA: GldG family protein [Planctomycetota bacterium]